MVGDTTILANRSKYVDFTLPFIKSGVGLIVPIKDQVKRTSMSFLMPLTWNLWITSFFFFFLIGFTVWVIEHRVNPDFRGPANYQASTIFWFAFSTMVFAPSTPNIPLINHLLMFLYIILLSDYLLICCLQKKECSALGRGSWLLHGTSLFSY